MMFGQILDRILLILNVFESCIC